MKCPACNREMEEKTLFTSVEYICRHCKDDGWQSVQEMLDLLSPMDLPLKLKFKDEDGKEGGVFIGDMSYFDRCPKTRKFKIQSSYDAFMGFRYELDD